MVNLKAVRFAKSEEKRKMASKHLGSAKIGSGRIELPESVIDFLFCLEGDSLEFVEKDGEVFIRRSTGGPKRAEFPKEEVTPIDEELEEELEETIETAIEDSLEEVGLPPNALTDEFIDVLIQRLISDLLPLFSRASGRKASSIDFSGLLQNIMSGLTGGDPSKLAENLDPRKFFEMFSMPPFQGNTPPRPHTRVTIEDVDDLDEIDLNDLDVDSNLETEIEKDSSSKKRYRIPIEDDEEEESD
jgi:bifunctional DNA-binding transcriptional regulator/antitoxin component of YhaV-PrlF toxin-antitoxin module